MAVQRTLIGNIKGPKGDKGDTGDTGARGAGATITIGSVTTTAYGGNANVTNSGTATDAVFDFVLPQGAPGETVTDMENLTLSSMTEPSVQFPTPSIGDTGKVVFGKITKWFSDMTTLVATKLNAANVVNNLTTTASGYALDARQGKAINDKFASREITVTSAASNVQITSQSVRRNGSIVSGSIELTIQSTVPAWAVLINDFPANYYNIEVIFIKADASDVCCAFLTNGTLRNRAKSLSAGTWFASLNYIPV